jgi:Xaa-Pro aminopeptidase
LGSNTFLTGITQDEVISHCVRRRAALSAAFTGVRLVIPSGGPKQRSNDTDYLYRPHTAFAYYTGVQGVEANPDSVLVMDPADGGHTPILFINPRSTRDTSAFTQMQRMANYGLVAASQLMKPHSVTELKFARLQS